VRGVSCAEPLAGSRRTKPKRLPDAEALGDVDAAENESAG